MTEETFENAPITIGELRANKSEHGGDWSPREVLISLLRAIDKKEVNIKSLIIYYTKLHPDRLLVTTSYYNASASTDETIGMTMRGLHRFMKDTEA